MLTHTHKNRSGQQGPLFHSKWMRGEPQEQNREGPTLPKPQGISKEPSKHSGKLALVEQIGEKSAEG